MNRNMKGLLISLAVVFLGLWIGMDYYNLNIKNGEPIQYSSEAVLINLEDKTYISMGTFELSGLWVRDSYLFLDSQLSTHFEDQTVMHIPEKLHLALTFDKKSKNLGHLNLENPKSYFGLCFGHESMTKFVMQLNDENDLNTEYYLITPARNLDEARSIINQIVPENAHTKALRLF